MRYEHDIVRQPRMTPAELNRRGTDGWELVAISADLAVQVGFNREFCFRRVVEEGIE